tara:strand:+ start:905 stop:1033 length:129 start_codon:yes stop_codon:yes gene_type:complete
VQSHGSDDDKFEEDEIEMINKDDQKKKSKFANENTMAKSNLR